MSGWWGGTGKRRIPDFQVVTRDEIVDRRRLRCVWSGVEETGNDSDVAKGVAQVSNVGGGGKRCKMRDEKV